MKQRPRTKNFNGIDHGYDVYGKHSDDSGEEIDLYPRNNAHKAQQYLEADILHGDTLQAIALRFNCSVSLLKKVNNIHRENEIYARRKIKIPIKAFSLLTETLPAVHTSGSNSPTKVKEVVVNDVDTNDPSLNVDLQQKLIVASVNAAEVTRLPQTDYTNVNIPSTSSNQFSNSDEIFNDVTSVSGTESVPLLDCAQHEKKRVEDIVLKEFTSKGDNFGIKLIPLLLFILLLCIIVPLLYVLDVAEHPEKYHSHN